MAKTEVKPCLRLDGENIIYEIDKEICWNISVKSVEVVGEYTDSNGPYIEDYFIVFVTAPQHERYIASFYACGRDLFLHDLGETLNCEINCGLCGSTDLDSRVMWPLSLVGKKLFDFVPVRSKSILGKIRQWLSGECNIYFSAEVKKILKSGQS